MAIPFPDASLTEGQELAPWKAQSWICSERDLGWMSPHSDTPDLARGYWGWNSFLFTSAQLCLLLQPVHHQGGCRAPLFSPHSILLCFPRCHGVTRIQANVPTNKRTPSTFFLPPCELPAQPSSRHRQDKTWGGMEQADSQAQGETTRNIQGTERAQ